ncbi:1300_t:CDS:1, partial [Dentiscutata heterogama]
AIKISEDCFSTNLPALKTPELPSSIPTDDPITLIGELSPQCQSAFLEIVTSPQFFECVPVAALLPLLTDPTFLS